MMHGKRSIARKFMRMQMWVIECWRALMNFTNLISYIYNIHINKKINKKKQYINKKCF